MSEPAPTAQQDLTQVVGDLWRTVLGIEGIEGDDDFFDLGGDSLVAERLADLLSLRLGTEIATFAVFEHPTIAELTDAIAAQIADHAQTAQRGDSRC